MVKFTIYTWNYTSSIAICLLDADIVVDVSWDRTTTDPSWIQPAADALGALQVYETTLGRRLTILDQVFPSILLWLFPTVNEATKFAGSTTVLMTFPPPFNGTLNPHMAYEHGNEVFVPDLGGGKVWRIGRTGGPGDFSIHRFIPQPLGTGPRHTAIFDDTIYLLQETANLTAQTFLPNPTAPSPPNATTVSDDVPADGTYAAAELLLSPTSLEYPHLYLYASNRNIGGTPDPRGDSIAIFDPLTKPELTLVKQAFTCLIEIRGSLGLAR
ncbi:Isomerase YbhE [Mycena sanguinolenta]|uniref:Isomerase YbhE n=1 Tax=Mycena sanguinolenta TaxID=230812 RepID=A0A8H6X4B8_9AGAR|nr:Isomerase YbhE [Mycena sanguinolenta]